MLLTTTPDTVMPVNRCSVIYCKSGFLLVRDFFTKFLEENRDFQHFSVFVHFFDILCRLFLGNTLKKCHVEMRKC